MTPKWHPDQASKIHTEPVWALPLAFGFAAAFAVAFASAAMASAKRSNLETTAKSPCPQKIQATILQSEDRQLTQHVLKEKSPTQMAIHQTLETERRACRKPFHFTCVANLKD